MRKLICRVFGHRSICISQGKEWIRDRYLMRFMFECERCGKIAERYSK